MCGIEGKFTNHQIRESMISILLEEDFDGKQVCGRTGHRSLKSLDTYHGPSERMQRQTSAILGSLEPNKSAVGVLPNRNGEFRRGALLPIGNSQVLENVIPKSVVGEFRRGVKRKAEISLDEMIINQQQLFNQQNSIMSKLYGQRKVN